MQTITTLAQAEQHLRQAGIVRNETVEDSQLLKICGFDTSSSNQSKVLKRQAEKHNLNEGVDFTPSIGAKFWWPPKDCLPLHYQRRQPYSLGSHDKRG